MMELNITNEELNALKLYINERYKAINQMLVSDAESDIALLSNEVENSVEPISYTREFVIENLRYMKLIYKLILKHCYKVPRQKSKIYRGTNIAEIERSKNEPFIDKPLIATKDREFAENRCAANWNRPASMNISLENNVPYIVVSDLLPENKKGDTIVIAPFTKIKKITESLERKLDDTAKYLKTYDVELEKQVLDELTDRERNGLYGYIVENAYCINKKLEDCIELEKENAVNFENIRKLEQLLTKYENAIEEKENGEEEYTEIERENDFESLSRVTRELNELKETSTNLFQIRKENIDFVNLWKRNIAVYMIAECREIEKLFEGLEYPEPIVMEEPQELEKNADTNNQKEQEETKNEDMINEDKEEQDENNKDVPFNEEKETVKKEEKIPSDIELESGNLGKKLMENRMKVVNGNLENKLGKIVENVKENIIEGNNSDNTINLENSSKNNIIKFETANNTRFEKNNDNIIELKNYSNMKENSNENNKEYSSDNGEESKEVVKNEENSKEDENTKIFAIVEDEEKEETDPLYAKVKGEAKENVEAVEKLLENIGILITKQQNHAKIAGNMGASYSALNNAFEMRKVSENLLELLQNISLKVKSICEREKTPEIEEELEKISKNNIEVSTLINYLNNPKIAARNSKATRFDEMAIIEENELKRGIAEKIREIRGEAELKKLKDDLEIIEDKGTFSRILGIITGKNKLDNIMIEQIEVRQHAIRKSLSKKLSLAHNYSIHELMADITMFVDENEDDELIEDDVNNLKALAEELRRNYVVLESKVQSIIEEKDGSNFPIDDRKRSRQELIEMETYRFLKKYGYDNCYDNREEPKYQDTMANEIARVVEYINSSKIL